MSYKYSFADNETYNAEDVNNITRRLVSGGIADPFTDGVPYNLSKFNEVGTLLYAHGVVPETDETLKVIKINENTVRILPGAAFFHYGAVIEITGDGHDLHFEPGVKNYVELKDDLKVSGTCFPVCETVNTGGKYKVRLAEITETGTIIDKRTYAKGKLPGYASNANYRMEITDEVRIEDDIPTETKLRYSLGDNCYQYLVIENCWDGFDVLGVYKFGSGEISSFASYTISAEGSAPSFSKKELLFWRSAVCSLSGKASLEENELVIDLTFMNGHLESYTGNVPVKMYLF